MDQQQPKAETCRNMDSCLRRLKQELLSMKEAGDGLHAQMNSMMGALQELKLLQVQTALDNLDISGRPINRGNPFPAQETLSKPSAAQAAASERERNLFSQETMNEEHDMTPSTKSSMGSRSSFSQSDHSTSINRSSLGASSSSSSASSLESDSEESEQSAMSAKSARSVRSENDLESIPKRWSGYSAPQANFYGPTVGNPPSEPTLHSQDLPQAQVVDLPGILYSLSREGPSLDSEYSQESTDDASDWTSSLMSRRRNRQPLVLGDNVFADLVGNWLDLPDVERDEGEDEENRMRTEDRTMDYGVDRPDSPAHPLRLSRSQEICRKFSLTTNIFKKFLRSVRPDRDKLLKERPGWMAPELMEGDLLKRPKKQSSKSPKGSFYLPFWTNGQQGKNRASLHPAEIERKHYDHQQLAAFPQQPFTGIYLDRRQPEKGLRKMHPLFDCNTAVWV